ncbi:TRAP transporter substrate-binding protein DctP, partial [Pantoea sp. SIMBA_133]
VEFERLVEEGSDGEIDVQIFPSSQMGPDRAMIEGVQTGILEMAVSPSSFFNNWDPAFGVVELAYIYPDKDTALDVLDGPEGD